MIAASERIIDDMILKPKLYSVLSRCDVNVVMLSVSCYHVVLDTKGQYVMAAKALILKLTVT